MNAFNFEPIGIVINPFDEPEDYRKIKEYSSTIEIFEGYSDALLGIEENQYLDIIFYFHKSVKATRTDTATFPGVDRGVFASRSPKRPNLIGVTTVKLLQRNGNKLVVMGLDALNGSPVLDIKNSDTSMFAYETDNNPIHQAKLKSNPRIDIRNEIHANRTETLLIKAAQMHGHFCPGLAMGVMAATLAMNELNADSNGMEDLLAITETNNCFADGVQLVTGCTFGNNSLIFKDLGKTAFTLSRRDGNGIRIISKPSAQGVIRNAFPDFNNLYAKVVEAQNHNPELVAAYQKSALDRAFGTLSLDINQLFDVQRVTVQIPSYAKIHQSIICSKCGESTMITRAECINHDNYKCLVCANKSYNYLTGNGINQ